MKFAVFILFLGAAGGGAFYAHQQLEASERRGAFGMALADLKRDFVVNTASLHALGDADYRKDIGIHLSKYFVAVADLGKKYPELSDVERVRKENAEKVQAGRLSPEQKQQREERLDATLELYKKMAVGQYRPLYSRADKSFRFDIYDIAPTRTGVKLSYAHWGPFDSDHKPGEGAVTYKSILGTFQVPQEKGKPVEVPQIEGDAQPPSLQIAPERWVAEFPPGVEIGHYELPQFPPQATAITLTFELGVRTIGGTEVPVKIEFTEVPIPDAWKVPAGQVWQAEERRVEQEELQAAGGGAKPAP